MFELDNLHWGSVRISSKLSGSYNMVILSVSTSIVLKIFAGNLLDEEAVLNWMMRQKTDESIEDIDREKLFEYIDSKEFLAVVFCE